MYHHQVERGGGEAGGRRLSLLGHRGDPPGDRQAAGVVVGRDPDRVAGGGEEAADDVLLLGGRHVVGDDGELLPVDVLVLDDQPVQGARVVGEGREVEADKSFIHADEAVFIRQCRGWNKFK